MHRSARKIIVSLALLGYFTAGFANQPAMMVPPPTPVEFTKVQQSEVKHGVTSTGELRANRSIILKSEIAGKVTKLTLPEGKIVEEGTVLVELDDAVAKANLNQVRVKHEHSQQHYERLHKLSLSGTGSASARDEAYANMRIEAARVSLAKAQCEKTKLKAPFTGMLGLRQVNVGDYIDPGQPLINIDDISALLVDFKIPEKYLGDLKEGQSIEVISQALPNEVFLGTIYAIAPQIDPVTRSLQARASLPNKAGKLRPGLFAKIQVIFAKNAKALLVPEQAVFMNQNAQFVYRIIDNKAKLTPVFTGMRENGLVEILSGLSLHDTIAKSGHMRLFDDASVTDVLKSH